MGQVFTYLCLLLIRMFYQTEHEPLCTEPFFRPFLSLPHTNVCYTSSPIYNSFENWNPLWGDVTQISVEKLNDRQIVIQKIFPEVKTNTQRKKITNTNSTWGKLFICKLANAATKSELRWVIYYSYDLELHTHHPVLFT